MIAFAGMSKPREPKRKGQPKPAASDAEDVQATTSDVQSSDVADLAELTRVVRKYGKTVLGVLGLLAAGAWYITHTVHGVDNRLSALSAEFKKHVDNHNKQWSNAPDVPAPERGTGPMQLPNVDKGPELDRPAPPVQAPPQQTGVAPKKPDARPKQPGPTDFVSPSQCIHRASMKIMSCDLAQANTCRPQSWYTPERYQEFVSKSGARGDAIVCDSVHDGKRYGSH